MNSKRLRNILFLLAFAVFFTNFGYFLGNKNIALSLRNTAPFVNVVNRTSPVIYDVDFSLFWEVWGRLRQKYFDQSKLDYQQMVWGAISGMTASLDDPYTVFLPPKENSDSKESLAGEFEGIGAQLGMKEKRIVIIAPLSQTPADKAGLKPNDWIMKVDGEETVGWSVPQTVEKIRGPKGSTVVLTILKAGDVVKLQESTETNGAVNPFEITIIRDTISVPSVELSYKDDIAVLKINQFGDATTEEWQKAVSQIVREGKIKRVVLDLRNNPGGYMQTAVFIAGEFLKSGIVVIQENYDGTREESKVNREGYLLSAPMAVLINEGSASASEILAGALKVQGRARLIGEKTFGKGTIQEPEDLSGGAGLHITIAKWLLPDGSWINGTGITPDIEVSDNLETENDEQLEVAVETVKKM